MSGFETALDYVLAGPREFDDPYAARAMMDELGLDAAADPARLSGGEARRAAFARALARSRTSCCSTSRPIISTSRHRMARGAARAEPLGARPHQPRPAAARRSDQRHGLARPRPHAPARPGLRRVRGVARPEARGGGDSSATSSTADRRGRALDALRRHRAAQAQHAPGRRTRRSETRAARGAAADRRRRHDRAGREGLGRAGDRRRAGSAKPSASARSCAISRSA